jgi:2-methylcitrate dehydratase PrpD
MDAHHPAAAEIVSVQVRTPQATIKPLIHSRPSTGAQGQFSLEYGVAAAILDGFPGRWSFTDAAVAREEAQQLLRRVRFVPVGDGEGLLDGECEILVERRHGPVLSATLDLPEGAPDRPPSDQVLAQKGASCLDGLGLEVSSIDWDSAGELLDEHAG